MILSIAILQFVAIFWFLSRGGMDMLMPEEINTRFSDVWGQDHVLRLIKENIAFLEKPDEIEAKGGYIPGGILLWGPPGTGKTLLGRGESPARPASPTSSSSRAPSSRCSWGSASSRSRLSIASCASSPCATAG